MGNTIRKSTKKTIQQLFFDSSDMSGFPSRKDMDQNPLDSNPVSICEVQGGPVPGWILVREFFTVRTSPLPLGLITFIQKNYEKQYSLHTFKTINRILHIQPRENKRFKNLLKHNKRTFLEFEQLKHKTIVTIYILFQYCENLLNQVILRK